jgi:hypothetical protein
MFQLAAEAGKHRRYPPYVFTEQRVAKSSVVKSDSRRNLMIRKGGQAIGPPPTDWRPSQTGQKQRTSQDIDCKSEPIVGVTPQDIAEAHAALLATGHRLSSRVTRNDVNLPVFL